MPGRFSLYIFEWRRINVFATVFDTTIEENYEFIKDIYRNEPFRIVRLCTWVV